MPKDDEREYTNDLLPHHAELLRASAIAPEVAEARGYRSVKAKAVLQELGFGKNQCRVPALLIPIWGVSGEIVLYQTRPDCPRIQRGRALKYETPRGARMVLDVPPGTRPWLGDPKRPLFITEGSRKADSAVTAGLVCISLLGVWNFRGTNEHQGKVALPDWENVALNGRRVFIAFDSDVMLKPEVHRAMARLKGFLESKKARVRYIYLPSAEGGCKMGLDDFLALGHTIDDLLRLSSTELIEISGDDTAGLTYEATATGLVWNKPTQDGPVATPIANFSAFIVAGTTKNDGAEQRRAFVIEATLRGQTKEIEVAAERFNAMNWAIENLGAEAIIFPGFSAREHTRAAIQVLSTEIEHRTVFTHLGWRRVENKWVYLHARGAIGPVGSVEGVLVEAPAGLEGFTLPDLVDGENLAQLVRAALGILDVAPDEISIPLLAAPYRAVLGASDFAIHFSGPTGAGKTAVCTLAQQFFGTGIDERNLPGSWSSTSNSNEALAFYAKDTLLVVDDFAPGGSQYNVGRMHRDADRLLRAQGNRSGRRRMRPDGSLRPPKPPRGLILSTGEDTPQGQSLRARVLTVELGANDLDWAVLTHCQEKAREGIYAKIMAAFLRWLASRYEQVASGIRGQVEALRKDATDEGQHRRTPGIVADLALGTRYFIDFALDVGAFDESAGERLWERVWAALMNLADAQSAHLASSDPVPLFFELLGSAISSGVAHIAGPDGEAPLDEAGAWGWRHAAREIPSSGGEKWQAHGDRVGWVDQHALYLDPASAFKAAQKMASESVEGISVSATTLWKRLHERALLREIDENRGTNKVRRVLEGRRRNVLFLDSSILEKADHPDHADPGRRGARGDHVEDTKLGGGTRSGSVVGSVVGLGRSSHDEPTAKPDHNPEGSSGIHPSWSEWSASGGDGQSSSQECARASQTPPEEPDEPEAVGMADSAGRPTDMQADLFSNPDAPSVDQPTGPDGSGSADESGDGDEQISVRIEIPKKAKSE